MLAERLNDIRQRLTHACQRSGRLPSAVTLIAVTKGVGVDMVREALALGISEIGENRVQEARLKRSALGSTVGTRWHMIGHLQQNKVKEAVELFDVVHSVDSLALAERLEREAAQRRASPLDVLLQVNISGEASKFGMKPEEVLPVARTFSAFPHLRWRGLMTIPPLVEDPEYARPYFRALRHLRDDLMPVLGLESPVSSLQSSVLGLSMGMSHDFDIAIEEGADYVRIGTAMFGQRV